MSKLILVRGLPGSGKSTLARSFGHTVYEADAFFTDASGYRFDRSKLKEAHAVCFRHVLWALSSSLDAVVANTFIQRWEAAPYILAAQAYRRKVEIVEPSTPWAFDPSECAKRCVHGVPEDAIRRMASRYEPHDKWI